MAWKKQYDAEKAEKVKAALAELKRRIKEGDTFGIYIFSGDEEYMKRYYCSCLKETCGEAVNYLSVQGELDFSSVCDFLSSVPMQEFSLFGEEESSGCRMLKLEGADFSKLSQREADELYELIRFCADKAIIVIYNSDSSGKNGKANQEFIKRLSQDALICEFPRASAGDRALVSWIKKHFDKEKIEIDISLATYLTEALGTDMCLLSNEIEKLVAYLHINGRSTLEREDVDAVSIKSEQAITFEVNDAILDSNLARGIAVMSRLKAGKTDPLMIFGAIAKLSGDLSLVGSLRDKGKAVPEITAALGLKKDYIPRKYLGFLQNKSQDYTKKVSRLVLEADEKLKGYSFSPYLVLENLIFSIISEK